MQISEQFRLAAKDWCEKDAAANILEETKSAVLSERMAALGDMPVSKAEMTVKASQEWREFIESMVTARKEANLAKVRCEWIRMRFHEWSSQQANDRAERRL
jgi:ribosomal protein L17